MEKRLCRNKCTRLALERYEYYNDRGRAGMNTGITFSGKFIGLRITKLAYPQKTLGWEWFEGRTN